MFADPPQLAVAPPPSMALRIWTWRDLAAGVGVMLAVFVLVVVVLAVFQPRGFLAGFAGTLSFELALALIVLALARRRGLSLARLGFTPPPSWWPVLGAWFGSYGIMGAYALGLEALRRGGLDVARFQGGNPLPVSSDAGIAQLAALGVLVVLVAPVCEELFFRAFVFRGTRGYTSLLVAALVSGVAFSLFHANLAVVLPFALIGALFAWSVESSGSLWTSIVAHTLVNGLSFGVSVWVLR